MFEPGDILVADTKSLFSKVIQQTTGHKYTHVSLYLGQGRTLEAGLNQKTFSTQSVDNYKTIDSLVLRPKLSQKERLAAATKGKDFVGCKYGTIKLGSLMMYNVIGYKLPRKYLERDGYTCSDAVNKAYSYRFGKPGTVFPWTFINSDVDLVKRYRSN